MEKNQLLTFANICGIEFQKYELKTSFYEVPFHEIKLERDRGIVSGEEREVQLRGAQVFSLFILNKFQRIILHNLAGKILFHRHSVHT